MPGDGLLTMEEILTLKLDADWVVLSACNTGAGAGAGAEAASGLGRAFFYAGTRAILVTNWSVHSASARATGHRPVRAADRGPKLSRGEALRQAMMALLDGPGFTDDRQDAVQLWPSAVLGALHHHRRWRLISELDGSTTDAGGYVVGGGEGGGAAGAADAHPSFCQIVSMHKCAGGTAGLEEIGIAAVVRLEADGIGEKFFLLTGPRSAVSRKAMTSLVDGKAPGVSALFSLMASVALAAKSFGHIFRNRPLDG